MPQEVGVRSQFLTREFSQGLKKYLDGIAVAITKTNQMTAAINNLGAQSSAVFATLQSNANATANAMRALANAVRAANRAMNPRSRAPRAAAGQPATAQRGNVNQMLTATGARAAQNTTQQINAAATATRNLGNQARNTTISIKSMNVATIAAGTAIGNVAAGAIRGMIGAMTGFGSKVLEIVTFFERMDLSIAFFTARSLQAEDASLSFNDALAQGEQIAQGLAIWLQRLAVASPFTTRTVATIFRTAQAYGLTRREAEQLTPLLLDFGAAAGLNEDILERLALALGQVRSRGKLTGEEVRQLGNSGLPVRDILVKALGIANSEFDELLESGALTSDVVIPHLIQALKNFEGAGARVAFGTIGGIVSAMEELQEISTAKFFVGFLEPLKQSLQDLFAVLNRPEVLAFITILGQELGVKFKNAVFGVVGALRSWLAAWQQLNPAIKQQIIVFAAATAGVVALAAAFGLMTLALGLITNPLFLIATTIGFLVSEWTSGFAVLKNITARASNAVGTALGNMIRFLGVVTTGLIEFVDGVSQQFFGLAGAMATYGFNIGASLAEGINASGSVLASALKNIGSLLRFFLAPGSPPRVAPDIDDWGKATMEEYIGAFGNANVKKSLGNGLTIVSDTISQELIDARRKAVDKLNAAHPDLNLTLAQDLGRIVQEGYEEVGESLADTAPLEEEATAAGFRVSESFVDGFLSNIPNMTPVMSEELQKVLSKIGGGAQLTLAGALNFGRFIEGFAQADFGVLDEVTGIVQNFLQNLVDSGEIEEIDLPRLLFGAREDLAQGIQDIARLGRVSEETMRSIRSTAGGASNFVLKLLDSYTPLFAATEDVEHAQDALNEVTEKYKAIITPLRKELEAINEANQLADDEEKILSLRRLIANEGVSERRRGNAQLQINQIIAQQKLRGLEKERDAATEVAEEELESREKIRDELQEQFEALQSNIQAQLTQMGLFGQEASLIKRLREEAEKLREKEMTEEELQLKFLEFQSAEMQDLIAAAKAKYDLERADSTVLEKQAAQIALAEIALRRRNREAEALKLGIPFEEIRKIRDLEVTLDDIGVKINETFEASSTDAFGDSLVDADAITKEWEKTLAQVRDRWIEIKTEIINTATAINENLPGFLKIFPEVEGGEPPIIESIKKYTGVLVALMLAMATYKIVVRVAALVRVIRSLATIGTLGGAAAGGAGGAAAAGGAAGVIAAITSSVIALGIVAATTTLVVLGLKAALDALGKSETARAEENVAEIDTRLGAFGPKLEEETNRLIRSAGVNTEQARKDLMENVIAAATGAIGEGLGDEHVAASIGNAVTRSIAEGLIFDTDESRAHIAKFQENLLTILKTTETGAPINILGEADITATPSAAQEKKVAGELSNFLAGITDKTPKGPFAENMKKLIEDMTQLGMEKAEIGKFVFGAFNEGVKAGLVADTPENQKAITKYIDGIISQLKKEGQIKSPSELTRIEVGKPLGQGIMTGINDVLLEGTPVLVTTSNLMFDELEKSFVAGKDSLVVVATTLKTTVTTLFTTMRTAAETQAKLMRTNILLVLGNEEKTGMLAQIVATLIGKESLVPRTIGKNFILGMARGITENKQLLADAIVTSMAFALGEGKNALATNGAGRQGSGPMVPINSQFAPRPASSAATTVNTSRVSNYYLSVTSKQNSQGIASDFGIMRTLEGR